MFFGGFRNSSQLVEGDGGRAKGGLSFFLSFLIKLRVLCLNRRINDKSLGGFFLDKNII
jgi:hypothetical protein